MVKAESILYDDGDYRVVILDSNEIWSMTRHDSGRGAYWLLWSRFNSISDAKRHCQSFKSWNQEKWKGERLLW